MNMFDTRKLIKTQQALFPSRKFLRETFTRQGETFNTSKVDVQYRKGQRKVAPYVSPLLPGIIIERQPFRQDTYEPALIKPMRAITSIDIARTGFGETAYSEITPAQRAERLLALDQAELDDYITRREELMVAELIFSGKITQIGSGVSQVLDFEFTNREVLATAAQWNQDNSDPFLDLARWKRAVQRSSGVNVTRVLMSPDAAQAFIANAKVQAYLNNQGGNFNVGGINPANEIDGATYFGSISFPGANLQLWSYEDTYLEDFNPDGTLKETPEAREMVPAGTVALLPSGNPFEFLYGAITITNPATNGFDTIALPRVPQSWVHIEPAQRFLQISSRPILIPDNVDGWYVAKVV